jgi:outer membrane protein assembly factor BamB
MFYVYALPVLSLAFVVWAVISRRLSVIFRRLTMVATILLACGVWTLVRSGGITGDASADFAWRWAETPEEYFLAQVDDETMALPPATAVMETVIEWPGFRGINRDGIIRGVRIETDWVNSPPVALWRRLIGPGCSSFAVHGTLLYTQEQRGDDEVVTCYSLMTGKPIWRHRDAVRFYDSHAGAGPRGTPTLSGGFVFTVGATGILNALDAVNGSVKWSRNAAADIKAILPGWGFTSSPLVIDDVVIIAIEGTLVAYDLATGDLRWSGPNGGQGYSSPHLLTIDSINQVLLMSANGATCLSPADGRLLWQHPWPEEGRIVQPALIAEGEILMSAGGNKGMRRLAVSHETDGWKTDIRWTTHGLKPSFNDFVIHKGHAFGFNGSQLACIDITDGKRMWQDGRYGGQIMLLADQDLLLVLSEKGELALVRAIPDKFAEVARFPAIEGKTWNHPVLAGDILVVRNSQEMAAFRLPLAGS